VIEFAKRTPGHAAASIAVIKEWIGEISRGQVVKLMQDEGHPEFKIQNHTKLWRSENAKDPKLAWCRVDRV
jgi:hypothetical protein